MVKIYTLQALEIFCDPSRKHYVIWVTISRV